MWEMVERLGPTVTVAVVIIALLLERAKDRKSPPEDTGRTIPNDLADIKTAIAVLQAEVKDVKQDLDRLWTKR